MSADKPTVTIYTDGGASPNPGPGGWGVVLIFDQGGAAHEKELSGGEANTTNNRMELTAAIRALGALKKPCVVEFHTDSQYVKRGISEWMPKWRATNFKKGKIQNVDLWEQLSAETGRHDIHWHWVKGHAGNVYNERVDTLATRAMAQFQHKPPADSLPAVSIRAYLRVSCTGAPGVGAWAVFLSRDGQNTILTGSHPKTNSARLDLSAAIAALEAIPEGEFAQVFTSNSYLRDGITQWVSGWKKSHWQKKTGGEVQYRNLWQHLDRLAARRKIAWILIKENDTPPEMASLTDPLKGALDVARQMKTPPAEPEFEG